MEAGRGGICDGERRCNGRLGGASEVNVRDGMPKTVCGVMRVNKSVERERKCTYGARIVRKVDWLDR